MPITKKRRTDKLSKSMKYKQTAKSKEIVQAILKRSGGSHHGAPSKEIPDQ